MIELRWLAMPGFSGDKILQYRTLTWCVDASGAMGITPLEWGPWVEVPVEDLAKVPLI